MYFTFKSNIKTDYLVPRFNLLSQKRLNVTVFITYLMVCAYLDE